MLEKVLQFTGTSRNYVEQKTGLDYSTSVSLRPVNGSTCEPELMERALVTLHYLLKWVSECCTYRSVTKLSCFVFVITMLSISLELLVEYFDVYMVYTSSRVNVKACQSFRIIKQVSDWSSSCGNIFVLKSRSSRNWQLHLSDLCLCRLVFIKITALWVSVRYSQIYCSCKVSLFVNPEFFRITEDGFLSYYFAGQR